MPLPSWAKSTPKPPEAEPLKSLWRIVGGWTWSCVDLPDHPRDPAIVAAIREFAPTAIPMVRKMVYVKPDSEERVVVVHHAIGRHVPHTVAHVPFYVEMPLDADFPRPTIIDYIHEDLDDAASLRRGAPPPYRPFDAELLQILKDKHAEGINLRKVEAYRAAYAAWCKTQMEKWAAEMEYQGRAAQKLARRVMDNLTLDDVQKYEALREARKQAARRARLQQQHLQGAHA